jgi:hypothetical protein
MDLVSASFNLHEIMGEANLKDLLGLQGEFQNVLLCYVTGESSVEELLKLKKGTKIIIVNMC